MNLVCTVCGIALIIMGIAAFFGKGRPLFGGTAMLSPKERAEFEAKHNMKRIRLINGISSIVWGITVIVMGIFDSEYTVYFAIFLVITIVAVVIIQQKYTKIDKK